MGTRPPRRTLPDGSPPPIRDKPEAYQVRVSRDLAEVGLHAIPSVDLFWGSEGDDTRDGYIELHIDMRDFSGVATATEHDPVDGRLIMTITPNTDPLPADWEDDPPPDQR